MSQASHLNHRGRLSLLACESGRPFAERVSTQLQGLVEEAGEYAASAIRQSDEVHFANREVKTVLHETVRGDDVYVVQCCDDPRSPRSVNDNLMACLTAIHAACQSDADAVTAVLTHFPYARQERRQAREPISARLVAAMIEDAGAKRVITLDVHTQAIEGFFRHAVLEDLHGHKEILLEIRRSVDTSNLCIVAPDTGGASMARQYAKALNCDLAVADKARNYAQASEIDSMRLVGDVAGKEVIIPDDMVATGGTLINTCRLVRDCGAAGVYGVCSHPFFNGAAIDRLDRAYEEGLFRLVVGTDAVWRGPDFARDHRWYREVSVAGLFARVIMNINHGRSVTDLLT